jgi:hypothetical protein
MPTDKPGTDYLPLSKAYSWYDYYTQVSDKIMVTGLVSPDLEPLSNNGQCFDSSDRQEHHDSYDYCCPRSGIY